MSSAQGLLSVLIVNYNTATLTHQCVASLRAQSVYQPDGRLGTLDIIVVDNASRPAERQALVGVGATLITNDENRGYGAALNQALKQTNSDFILFSNSDTWYAPGSLQVMIDAFRRLPQCGAVGPRLWWDTDHTFYLPPSDAVSLSAYTDRAIQHVWPRWRKFRGHQWRQHALRYWRAWQPLIQPMLSGACILTHKNVLSACGGFDEEFRLYYEDTDWCRRVQQKGYRLYYVPMAEVTHLYNQSAQQEVTMTQAIGRASEVLYFHKHYGRGLWSLLSRTIKDSPAGEDEPHHTDVWIDLGACHEPPVFSLATPLQGDYLWQLSPRFSCIPAIARFVSSPEELTLSASVWNQLGEGTFFARLFSLPDLKPLQQWRWRKIRSFDEAQERSDDKKGQAAVMYRNAESKPVTLSVIRPCRAEDEPEILRLFSLVFQSEMSPAVWRWKYLRDGNPPPAFVAEEEGKIVCHYGTIRQRVYWQGIEHYAWDAIDVMAHPRKQGRGLFRQTVQAFMRELCEGQGLFLYGFPTERHKRLGELLVGYEPVTRVHKVFKTLAPASSESSLANVVYDSLPLDWDQQWNIVRQHVDMMSYRDRAYLLWRYLARPDRHYRLVTIPGAPALAVVGRQPGKA